mmetsp:Transcript_9405/g.27159  ORF Transcript_9405/g.27159 Transcript_9405/m.27159 type:complete len:220 (+) Transcript_9405:2039-2698(+)
MCPVFESIVFFKRFLSFSVRFFLSSSLTNTSFKPREFSSSWNNNSLVLLLFSLLLMLVFVTSSKRTLPSFDVNKRHLEKQSSMVVVVSFEEDEDEESPSSLLTMSFNLTMSRSSSKRFVLRKRLRRCGSANSNSSSSTVSTSSPWTEPSLASRACLHAFSHDFIAFKHAFMLFFFFLSVANVSAMLASKRAKQPYICDKQSYFCAISRLSGTFCFTFGS